MRGQPKEGARDSTEGSETVEKPVEVCLPRTPVEGTKRLNSEMGNLPPNAFELKSAFNQPIGVCEKT